MLHERRATCVSRKISSRGVHVSKIWAKVKHKFHEVPPPRIFFATAAALLVAKVVLVADMLPVINPFPEKPLIYSVA